MGWDSEGELGMGLGRQSCGCGAWLVWEFGWFESLVD